MRVWICGVRGSTGAPGREFVRYGGHTSCLALGHDGEAPTLVIDAGTGLRSVTGLLDGRPYEGTILLSHLHWDHVQGLPFFGAGDREGARVHVLMPDQGDPHELMRRAFSPPHFPITMDELGGTWTLASLPEGQHEIEGFTVLALPIPHKGGLTFGFRVTDASSSLAYLADHSPLAVGPGPDGLGEYHEAARRLASGADLLVHDAQHTVEELANVHHLGHSAIEYGVGLGRVAGAVRVLLFHHDPSRTDADLDRVMARYREERPLTDVAMEGSVLDLPGRRNAPSITSVLLGSALFSGIDPADAAAIAGSVRRLRLRAARGVFAQGDTADGFYLVEEGSVRLGGADAPIRVVEPGDFFGELALLDGGARSTSATAEDDTSLLFIARDSFLRTVEQRPHLADRLGNLLWQRRRGEAAYRDVPGRLAAAIDALAVGEGRPGAIVEVLPVLLRDGDVFVLVPEPTRALVAEGPGGLAPHAVAAATVEAHALSADVVHSTSWRLDGGRLVLTYLAVVRGAPETLVARTVQRSDLGRGGATEAPERVSFEQVLEHALRHLAWLLDDDPVVAAALEPSWKEALADYRPAPFVALSPTRR